MFFDKNYIELICSPDILVDESDAMSNEDTIRWLDELGLRYEYEERAAIYEYDAGFSRKEADSRALREIVERIRSNEPK
jgi:hypothetical protein